jgi:hypothetical protein
MGCLEFSALIFWISSNLAKYTSIWLSLEQHHKIEKKRATITKSLVFENHGGYVPTLVETDVFLGPNFAIFWPEKYDFDLYKGFSMGKMAKILQISKNVFSQTARF